MKVLVMTANGMFGNRVVKSLSERGVQVRAMVRDGGQLGTSIVDNWGRPLDYWFTNNFMYDIQIICHAKPA